MNVDKRILLSFIFVALVGAGIGGYFHFRSSPISYPTPPDVKGSGSEPAVIEIVQSMRERVLREPASAEAWGNLGKVFLVNELEDESKICFAEAERLDPSEPQWPYFQATLQFNVGNRELALMYFLRAVDCLDAQKTGR